MVAWLINGAITWFAKAILAILKMLWGLLATTAFTSPDVSTLPQVTAITAKSVMVVNVCFVLAVITGLIIAALTGLLLVTWMVRLGVLIVLVGISPVALACHATPFTDGAAKLWWRSLLATLATVVLQAMALHTALSVFLNPDANAPQLGLPHDPMGTFNLFIVMCLLWVVIKIPGLMRRFVTKGGGGHNVVGLMLRMVLVQLLTSVLRMPFRRTGGGGGSRGGRPGGGFGGGGGPHGGGSRGGGGPRGGGGRTRMP